MNSQEGGGEIENKFIVFIINKYLQVMIMISNFLIVIDFS